MKAGIGGCLRLGRSRNERSRLMSDDEGVKEGMQVLVVALMIHFRD